MNEGPPLETRGAPLAAGNDSPKLRPLRWARRFQRTALRLLQFSTRLFFDGGNWLFSSLGRYHVFVLPAIGGLMVGPVIYLLAREAKGYGVPEVMTALIR